MDFENLASSKLGVFGGSGFYSIDNLKNVQELSIDTPYHQSFQTRNSTAYGVTGNQYTLTPGHGIGKNVMNFGMIFYCNLHFLPLMQVRIIRFL